MTSSLTEGYRKLERIIVAVERWLEGVDLAARGVYEPRAVKRRLAQRFAELALRPYLAKTVRGEGDKPSSQAVESTILEFGGIIVDRNSGAVRLRPKLLAGSLWEFVLCWLLTAAAAMAAFLTAWRRADAAPPMTLFYGVGVESHTGKQAAHFEKFCRRGPIRPLREASRLIIQSGYPKPAGQNWIEHSRIPLLKAFVEAGLNIRQFVRFWRDHFFSFYCYLRLATSCRLGATLGRDFAFTAAALSLNNAGLLQAVIQTSTNQTNQPLWMTHLPDRKFRTHMIRYSQNSVFPVYKDDQQPDPVPVPTFRHILVDEMWVWTPGYADQMRGFGVSCKYQVVGPILWYLPEDTGNESDEALRICVFDVTPIKPEFAQKNGNPNNYYSAENMIGFIADIISARDQVEQCIGKKIEIILKHKRSHDVSRDGRYIDHIQRLTTTVPNFTIVESDTNIYSLVKSATLTVVALYSSPAYVACYVGRPTVFYDPTSNVVPVYEKLPGLSFVAGVKNLTATMMDVMTRSQEVPDASKRAGL